MGRRRRATAHDGLADFQKGSLEAARHVVCRTRSCGGKCEDPNPRIHNNEVSITVTAGPPTTIANTSPCSKLQRSPLGPSPHGQVPTIITVLDHRSPSRHPTHRPTHQNAQASTHRDPAASAHPHNTRPPSRHPAIAKRWEARARCCLSYALTATSHTRARPTLTKPA
ncbi:hypothetical protein C8Q78DRAFT_241006 [Trametes maxima]|nr:hypothetical protein C8Q78DRAFT_241006 [Trametes maxima]